MKSSLFLTGKGVLVVLVHNIFRMGTFLRGEGCVLNSSAVQVSESG